MPEPLTLERFVNALHLLGGAVFLGGIVAWLVVISPIVSRMPEAEAKARKRFRLLIAHALGLLILTGLYQIHAYTRSQEGVLQRPEGLFLMGKIMIAILAFLAFFFAPAPQEGSSSRRFAARGFYSAAAALAIVVVFLSRYIR